MKHLTVRNVDPALSKALERARRKSGKSLNQTVLELLRQALGVSAVAARSNGLAKLAGGWSQADLEAFEAATGDFEEIDEDLWK